MTCARAPWPHDRGLFSRLAEMALVAVVCVCFFFSRLDSGYYGASTPHHVDGNRQKGNGHARWLHVNVYGLR